MCQWSVGRRSSGQVPCSLLMARNSVDAVLIVRSCPKFGLRPLQSRISKLTVTRAVTSVEPGSMGTEAAIGPA